MMLAWDRDEPTDYAPREDAMLPGETILSGAPAEGMVFDVLVSGAGFYIGTADEQGPYSRESNYFASYDEANRQLGEWIELVKIREEAEGAGGGLERLRALYREGLLVNARV